MQQDFAVLDTSIVQRDSLLGFMDRLQYRLDTTGCRFVTDAPHIQANRYIRFATAQALHNSTIEDWDEVVPGLFVFKKAELKFALNAHDLQRLFAEKLVKQTKWVVKRKGGYMIRLASHMVKPAHESMTKYLGLA